MSKKPSDYPHLSFRVKKSYLDRLHAIHERTDESVSSLVNRALELALPKLEAELPCDGPLTKTAPEPATQTQSEVNENPNPETNQG